MAKVGRKRRSGSKSTPSPSSTNPHGKKLKLQDNVVGEGEQLMRAHLDDDSSESPASDPRKQPTKHVDDTCRFLGDPVPPQQATLRWPHRYQPRKTSTKTDEDDDYMLAKCHYLEAEVDGTNIFELNDDAHVMSDNPKRPFICKIVELFEGVDENLYFRAQWYYRSDDTVIKDTFVMREEKRIFFSDVQDDNPLDCLIAKVKIARLRPNVDLAAKVAAVPDCDYFYDMMYLVPYSTFILPPETVVSGGDPQSSLSSESDDGKAVVNGGDPQSSLSSESDDTKTANGEASKEEVLQPQEMRLLDLYCGCGAMSTGLTMGANLAGVKLVTRWAVDINQYACASLKDNHPETEVRNDSVDNFLILLKEWKRICASYGLIKSEETHKIIDAMGADDDGDAEDGCVSNEEASDSDREAGSDSEVFEVEKITGICFGDPKNNKEPGLYFKVHWKGYDDGHDTWEPAGGLGNCKLRIGEFVNKGFKDKLLPLPGDADVICGGPPCQGISGFNRFRNTNNPLEDIKNRQLLVYLEVVEYLKPKYVLMENVVDLVKMAKGYLGRYAMGALVDLNYQARMGMMAAGAYGLAQFRMRVFLWAAQPTEKLPQYPLPTHDLVLRGVIPKEFEKNTVAYDEGHAANLKAELYLGDAISDLPAVTNDELRDVIAYDDDPQTDFQRFIRKTKEAMLTGGEELITELYDHRPLNLNIDDFLRVSKVPKRKGASFRDFPEVRVRADNKVEWNPHVPREKLPSGKYLVPAYAMSYVNGTSSKPFGRLWWDETVPTVVGRAEPHNQIICHPIQDRVLTIRENARLQGFPDYYRLTGPPKERYIQVGNAVAVPVARALGFGLARACQGFGSDSPLFELPAEFPSRPSL